MRVLPFAFKDAKDDQIRAVPAITHAHKTSCEACVRMMHTARDLAGGVSPADIAGDVDDIRIIEVKRC